MASTAGEIKTEALPREGNLEEEAVIEYFKEENTDPIGKVTGHGSALRKDERGRLGVRFLPIGEETQYDEKAMEKG